MRWCISRALIVLAVACAACESVRPPTTPMATRVLGNSSAGSSRCLVVFLPGRRDNFGDYGRRGFPEMASRAGVLADFVEADAHFGYYQARTISGRLYEDVVAPARARGVERIWMIGISMGGLGAILYAREHPEIGGGVV